jgi:predicted membrane channel-forming protein YqfA (hemolysin III family)
MQDRRVDLGSCHSRAYLPGTTRLVRNEPRYAERMLSIKSQHSFARHRIHSVCLAALSLLRHGLQRDRPSSACRCCPLHLVLPWSSSLFRMFCMVCVISQLNWTPADFATRSCHIIWNLSAPAACFGNRLDFSGIVLLMWGASIPSIHYAFVCNTMLEYLHCSLVSQSVSTTSKITTNAKRVQVTISAFGCIVFTLHPQFLGPVFRKYRALMYASFGLSALLFMSHSIILYGFAVQRKRLALEWMILMGALNIIGACFYASRVRNLLQHRDRLEANKSQLPERWFPLRFDFVGASHQIFHLLVLAAALVHYKALVGALRESRGSQNLCMLGDLLAS